MPMGPGGVCWKPGFRGWVIPTKKTKAKDWRTIQAPAGVNTIHHWICVLKWNWFGGCTVHDRCVLHRFVGSWGRFFRNLLSAGPGRIQSPPKISINLRHAPAGNQTPYIIRAIDKVIDLAGAPNTAGAFYINCRYMYRLWGAWGGSPGVIKWIFSSSQFNLSWTSQLDFFWLHPYSTLMNLMQFRELESEDHVGSPWPSPSILVISLSWL
jgi:hypothetical protein